jgi:hypothetical protein
LSRAFFAPGQFFFAIIYLRCLAKFRNNGAMNMAEQSWNRLKAKRLLDLMDGLEGSAQEWDCAQTDMLRRAIATRYRNLVGIEPDQRDSFRSALRTVREQGNVSLQELRESFRDQSRGLLTSSARTSGSVGNV